jgi:hypothetical protein
VCVCVCHIFDAKDGMERNFFNIPSNHNIQRVLVSGREDRTLTHNIRVA